MAQWVRLHLGNGTFEGKQLLSPGVVREMAMPQTVIRLEGQMAAQYPEPAEACFLNAQSLDSSEFRWPYYLAHLYRSQGDLAKSRTLFERALALRPDDVDALVWLGNIYLLLGLPDAADTPFGKALSLEPKSVSARYGLGRVALARNDPRRAVTYLEDVLKLDPEAAGAHYPLSQAYSALGETARASEHLRQRRERDILPRSLSRRNACG